MKKLYVFVFAMFTILFSTGFVLAVNGASSLNVESSSTAGTTLAQSTQAIAGNLTEITISGYTTTQTWQGYFGNVSGAIELSDSSNNVLYNWSAANPSGEVLASINQTVDWVNIACASAANSTVLEAQYGATGTDGVNETFTGTGSVTIAGQSLNSCMSTKVFDDTGSSGSNFEELLLWDGDAAVFASILENDVSGFDGKQHDFEMLVLEDGHGNTDTQLYYFFVELD